MDIDLVNISTRILKKESPERIKNDIKEYLNRNISEIVFNWHPLGFVHSKLCEIPEMGDLRLHIWLEGLRKTQLPCMPIHDHMFNVNSLILAGTVTNHIYELGSSEGDVYKIYEAEYINGGSMLYPTEELLKCNLKSSTLHRKGDFYVVEKGVFHDTSVEDECFAATVVIATGKDETIKPKILGPDENKPFFYKREVCNERILDIINERIL